MTDLHTLGIKVDRGLRVLTTVTLDGQPLRGVTRVRFDTGDATDPDQYDGFVHVVLDMSAVIDVGGELRVLEEPDSRAKTPA